MGKGRRYDQEYKNMIVDLFKSGMSLSGISSEYGIARSTINGWIKDVKEIKVDENEVMTLKEVKELKREMAGIKEENEILKKAIIRIYKVNKSIYGAPRIHYILCKEGFNVSLKRVKRKMSELSLYSINVKKYRPHSKKKVAEGLENVLQRDFTTTSINEKWVVGITYIHTTIDGWCYLASVLDLHSKKIIGYAFCKRMTNNLVIKALKNAYYSQNPDKNKQIIFHIDLGSQYTNNDLKELCKERRNL